MAEKRKLFLANSESDYRKYLIWRKEEINVIERRKAEIYRRLSREASKLASAQAE